AASCRNNACLTGRCKGDGSGCEPSPDGKDCGTTCTSATVLATKTCAGGACTTSSGPCAAGQVCNATTDRCEMPPPPDQGPGDPCAATSDCRAGLTCLRAVCCAAAACNGPCLTGACKADGSGC